MFRVVFGGPGLEYCVLGVGAVMKYMLRDVACIVFAFFCHTVCLGCGVP